MATASRKLRAPWTVSRMGECHECEREAVARGLCDRHWKAHKRLGDLEKFDLLPSKYDSIFEDLQFIGFNEHAPIRPQLKEFAPRVGVTFHALEAAFYRKRKLEFSS